MRYRLLATTVTLSILLPVGASLWGLRMRAQQFRPLHEANRELAIALIARDQGLHEAARANGGSYGFDFNMYTAWHRARAETIQQLVGSSPLIVVGAVQAGQPRMHVNGSMIDTIYPVLVSETIKGDARSVVKVRVPGGRIAFPDGTVAEVRTPGFALRVGDTYVLALKPAPVGVGTDPTDVPEGVQVLTVGLEGVVDVSTGRAESLAAPEDPIRAQQNGRVTAEFLNELRTLARHPPSTTTSVASTAPALPLAGSPVAPARSEVQSCAIAGRVADERGKPVAHLAVIAVPVEWRPGQPRVRTATVNAFMQQGTAVVTDDRGEFRIGRLRPQQYYVNAMQPPPTVLGGPTASKGFPPTFYPDAREVASATAIDLMATCDVGHVDIVLHEVRLATIRGSVVGADGSPHNGGGLTAVPHGGAAPIGSVPVWPNGTFILTGVPPGSYTLRASPSRGERAGFFTLPAIDIVVGDVDLTGVIVAPPAPLTVRGRLSFDHAARPASLSQNQLHILAHVLNTPALPAPGAVTADVDADGSFVLQVPSASLIFGFNPGWPFPEPWRIAAVRVAGVDVTDELRVEKGLDDVEVELTARAPRVSGVAIDPRVGRVRGYTAVFFSQDPQRWRLPFSRHVQATRSDAAGSFSIVGLPAGRYYGVAVPEVAGMQWQNPATLEQLAPRATALSIPGHGDVQLPLVDCQAVPGACAPARQRREPKHFGWRQCHQARAEAIQARAKPVRRFPTPSGTSLDPIWWLPPPKALSPRLSGARHSCQRFSSPVLAYAEAVRLPRGPFCTVSCLEGAGGQHRPPVSAPESARRNISGATVTRAGCPVVSDFFYLHGPGRAGSSFLTVSSGALDRRAGDRVARVEPRQRHARLLLLLLTYRKRSIFL